MTTAEKAIVIQRETIKPSSPTPANKKILKLSFLDALIPAIYMPLIFVFPSSDKTTTTQEAKLQKLKTSLSKTLSLFYSLAGRVIDNSYVDCNDSGAEFTEAKMPGCVSDFLRIPDSETMKQFLLAAAFQSSKKATDTMANSLLLVQATFFDCGGLVIGLCMSHKIADAATLSTFLKCWSSMALHGHAEEEMIPVFMGDSVLPQSEVAIPERQVNDERNPQSNYERRRFVFEYNKIEALKAKATYDMNKCPTKVAVVTALIWKCATKASRTITGNHSRQTALSLPVNFRNRFVPPLPQNYSGNLAWPTFIMVHQDRNSEIELHNLIREIKKELQKLSDEVGRDKGLSTSKYIMEKATQHSKEFGSGEVDCYAVSSWCKFDLYDFDFGWGKPVWLGLDNSSINYNLTFLMDTNDGKGIEAWVCLEKDMMALFESDLDLLEYAQVNPPTSFN